MSARLALAACLGSVLLTAGAVAAPTVTAAWIPVPPPGARVLAGFMTITNPGPGAARLTAVSSPVARKVELHAMEMADGVARMRRRDVLDIPAGGAITLAPGGLHLMIYLEEPAPTDGARVPLELTFADGTRTTVEALVRPRDADGESADPHAHP